MTFFFAGWVEVADLCYTFSDMRKRLLLFIWLLLGGICFASSGAEEPCRFRLGPFFEWGSKDGDLTRFAIRPFFAWETSGWDQRDRDMDVLWPLSHFGWRGDEYHWRVLMTFWQEADRTDRTSRDYSFVLPPVWVNGRDEEKNYWGLFPIWGSMPKAFFVEDIRWALFPFWLRYRTGGSRAVPRDYILWPFFSLKHDPDKTRWSLWPLYGTKHEPDEDSRFILWPFWNDRTFHRHNHTGTGWMLWPLAERVNTDTEQTYGLLPPFFRYTETTSGARLLRAPWPLFERYTDPKESTWKFWRFWGMTHRGSRDGWWFLYPIVLKKQQQTVNLYNKTFRFWPFYTDEVSYGYTIDGEAHLQSSYFRFWPFFSSSYNEREGLKRKTFILFPIRDVPAIERNWAPFWTFYTAEQAPGSDEVRHELFWGLIKWRTHPGEYAQQESVTEGAP